MGGGAWWAAVYEVAKSRPNWVTSLSLFTFMHWRRKWQPTPVFLPGESQGPGSLVGCRLCGFTESDIRLKRLSSSRGHLGIKCLIPDILLRLFAQFISVTYLLLPEMSYPIDPLPASSIFLQPLIHFFLYIQHSLYFLVYQPQIFC